MSEVAVAESRVSEKSQKSGLMSRWLGFLTDPIDGSSLAVFRMCLAACLLASVWLYTNDIEFMYLAPKFHFTFIPGLPALEPLGMYAVFSLMAFSAGCIGIGLFYRPACILFGICQTYLFLLDKSYYQNHYYLVCMLSFLMAFLPANKVWSFDRASEKAKAALSNTIPRWAILVLRAQFFCVYFYGGVAKINEDWLRGQPQTAFLQQYSVDHAVAFVGQPWFAQLITWGGLLFDLSIGFILSIPQTFWLGALMATFFHVTNSQLFHIGIFPWLMIGTIGLFAPTNWPRIILAKFGVKQEKEALSYAEAAKRARLGLPEQSSADEKHPVYKSWTPAQRTINLSVIAILHLYILAQILIPLRHFLHEGNNSWTEEAHRYSWQMMLRVKMAQEFAITMLDPKTQQEITGWQMSDYLNSKQIKEMQTRPDMILQFVHFLANEQQAKTGVRPIIHVKAVESLNTRPPQDLIDPTVNMAEEAEGQWDPHYIVPLKPLPKEWLKDKKTVTESTSKETSEDLSAQ